MTRFPDDPDRLLVDAGFEVESWTVRPPARPDRPELPGTALAIETEGSLAGDDGPADGWWEIVGCELRRAPGQGDRPTYELRPWDPKRAVRHGERLTPSHAEKITARHRRDTTHAKNRDRIGLFLPVIGLLPEEDQSEIESRYGLPEGRATMLTAIPLFALSAWGIALAILGFYGAAGVDVAWAKRFLPLLCYLFLESAIRGVLGTLGHAAGSGLVVVPLRFLRLLGSTARAMGSADERLPAAPRPHAADVESWLQARDTVRPLPDAEDDAGEDGDREGADGALRRRGLEVLSPLPKEHWRAEVDLIRYRDGEYVLEERREVPGGHRFVLREPPPGPRRIRAIHEYRTDEVQEVYKEERRVTAEAWIQSLQPVVGLADPVLQEELAEIYRYSPERGTAQSVLFGLLFGVVSLRAGWLLVGPDAGLAPILMLVYGVILLWESVLRAVRLRRGRLQPSVLSGLVEPFLRRALRWRHRPGWVGDSLSPRGGGPG